MQKTWSMYSIEEAKVIRRRFWESFDLYSKDHKSHRRKKREWMLQKTGIKGFALKFDLIDKSAQVGFEIASKGLQRQLKYFEKMQSLKSLLDEAFEHQLIWNDHFQLENGKEVFRIYIEKTNVNLFKEADWNQIFEFFFFQMTKLEAWFMEYKDIIKMNEEEIFKDE